VRRLAAIAAAAVVALVAAVPAGAAGCDPIGVGNCLYPWPNDYFRENGHLALTPSMMPANSGGVPIDPTDYNRQDGFSPGSTRPRRSSGRARCRSPTSRGPTTVGPRSS